MTYRFFALRGSKAATLSLLVIFSHALNDTRLFGFYARYLENSGASTLKESLVHNVARNCTPFHINILARHGTRYPNDDYFFDFYRNFLELFEREYAEKGVAGKKFLEALQKGDDGALALQGRRDMLQLGRRVRSYWPELGSELQSDWKKVLVETTPTDRTQESAYWLVNGLLHISEDHRAGIELKESTKFSKCMFLEDVKSKIPKLRKEGLQFEVNGWKDPALLFHENCAR